MYANSTDSGWNYHEGEHLARNYESSTPHYMYEFTSEKQLVSSSVF